MVYLYACLNAKSLSAQPYNDPGVPSVSSQTWSKSTRHDVSRALREIGWRKTEIPNRQNEVGSGRGVQINPSNKLRSFRRAGGGGEFGRECQVTESEQRGTWETSSHLTNEKKRRKRFFQTFTIFTCYNFNRRATQFSPHLQCSRPR